MQMATSLFKIGSVLLALSLSACLMDEKIEEIKKAKFDFSQEATFHSEQMGFVFGGDGLKVINYFENDGLKKDTIIADQGSGVWFTITRDSMASICPKCSKVIDSVRVFERDFKVGGRAERYYFYNLTQWGDSAGFDFRPSGDDRSYTARGKVW
jgi:hypothetical protein